MRSIIEDLMRLVIVPVGVDLLVAWLKKVLHL